MSACYEGTDLSFLSIVLVSWFWEKSLKLLPPDVRQISRRKLHQIRYRLGLRRKRSCGSLQRSPRPCSLISGVLLLIGGRGWECEDRGEERVVEDDGMGGEGKPSPNNFILSIFLKKICVIGLYCKLQTENVLHSLYKFWLHCCCWTIIQDWFGDVIHKWQFWLWLLLNWEWYWRTPPDGGLLYLGTECGMSV